MIRIASILIAALLAPLLATACATGTSEPANTSTQAADTARITYASTMCFGTCPIIDASLAADGTLTITGVRPSFKTSVADTPEKTLTDNLGPAAFDALYAWLDAQDVWSLSGTYAGEICGLETTDHPAWTLTIEGTRQAHIRYDTGCFNFPEEQQLKALFAEVREQMKIDRFIETELPAD